MSSTTKDPQYANKIIQLAINRTAKNANAPSITSQLSTINLSPSLNPNVQTKTALTKEEVAKGQQDITQVNNDLQLLSTLLGRPVSPDDLPDLVNQFDSNAGQQAGQKSTAPPFISASTSPQPPIIKEVELLQNLLQANKLNEEATVEVPSDAYGKTNDAILATLLKQQGIGPAHNNVPVQQLISENLYPMTTARPRQSLTQRPSRPILDGLSWLWRTWQDTAPGAQNPTSATNSGRTKTRASSGQTGSYSSTVNGAMNFDEGLDSDTAAVSVPSK